MKLDAKRLYADGLTVENIFSNQANVGLLGDKKYVIEASWWRKWCDYVNFTQESDKRAKTNVSVDPELNPQKHSL